MLCSLLTPDLMENMFLWGGACGHSGTFQKLEREMSQLPLAIPTPPQKGVSPFLPSASHWGCQIQRDIIVSEDGLDVSVNVFPPLPHPHINIILVCVC
jgi:hypothetical protein